MKKLSFILVAFLLFAIPVFSQTEIKTSIDATQRLANRQKLELKKLRRKSYE